MPFQQNRFKKIFWKTATFLLPKKRSPKNVSPGDRHAGAKKPLTGAKDAAAPEKNFPRRFFWLGGLYLVTIVVLLAVVILRLGPAPVPEIPGLENELAGVQHGEQGGRAHPGTEGVASDLPAGENGDLASPAEEIPQNQDGDLISSFPHTPSGEDHWQRSAFSPGMEEPRSYQDVDAATAGAGNLPDAYTPASPLPRWTLYRAYGDYASEALPSGGLLHRRTRGVLLEGTPGAPVSALWDGVVVAVGEKSFPYGCFVVLEHEGGYSTLYGNIREIWVKKGDQLNRGEHLGLLPHAPAARNRSDAVTPPNGDSAARNNLSTGAANNTGSLSPEQPSLDVSVPSAAVPASGPLTFRTIVGGYPGGESGLQVEEQTLEAFGKVINAGIAETEALTQAAGDEEAGGDAVVEPVGTYLSFHGENPLLYLELRRGNSCLDPLLFIRERN